MAKATTLTARRRQAMINAFGNKHASKIGKLEAVSAIGGLVCPIPIVGEGLLAYPIYRVLDSYSSLKGAAGMGASLGLATIARIPLYSIALSTVYSLIR